MQQPHTCDLLVTARYCVTQDAERRILENCAIAITGGLITEVGLQADMARYQAVQHLSLGDSLLMPGLVNAHTHVSMTFLRGLGDDLPLAEWLNTYIFPKEKHLDAEMVQLGALIGCAEMIRTGTTAFADMYLIENAVAAAVDISGLRALLGEGIFMFPSPAYQQSDEGFALVRSQAEQFASHPRIRIGVMPHAEYTTDEAILRKANALAAELGLHKHMHLSETREEVRQCREKRGVSPVAYLDGLDFFATPTSVAHCTDLDDADLDILARKGVTIVHNPRSNMKLASGVARIPEMLAKGMAPALGTDGAASNNALNMFQDMSAAALLHKVHNYDAATCKAQDALDMATRNGAKALGWPGLGELSPGSPADMIALDLTSPNLMPMYHPVSALVYAASGHELRMSMVGGKVLYQDGHYHTLDYPALVHEAEKLRRWTLSR